jgi:hypothetical protein
LHTPGEQQELLTAKVAKNAAKDAKKTSLMRNLL